MDASVPADGLGDFAAFLRTQFSSTARHVEPIVGSLAEDVAQEAFIVALNRWDHVSALDAPHAWVRLVARRMAYRLRARELDRADRETASYVSSPAAAGLDSAIDLERALTNLPERQRAAVRLHYLADLPVAQVASVLGASEAATKVWLHRARERLAVSLLGLRGTWATEERWSIDDLVRHLRRIGAAEHLATVVEELPVGHGRWAIKLGPRDYRFETDEELELDRGTYRLRQGQIVLAPWNNSGVVAVDARVEGTRAGFRLRSDSTTPTKGVPDEVYLRMILDARRYARLGRPDKRENM
jgi:RNA polymerase sigma-70 factor, ECF subfamily